MRLGVRGWRQVHGHRDGRGAVSFRLGSGAVKRVQASVTMTCISAAPTRSDIEIYIVAPSATAKSSRTGRFSFKLALPKQQFTDSDGQVTETLYSVKASVEGRIPGHSSSGTVKVSYNKYWTAYDPSPTPAGCPVCRRLDSPVTLGQWRRRSRSTIRGW
jgi:hypothetical protein